MRKLKKQAEDAKARKALAKKDKDGNSNTTSSPKATSKTMIDTSGGKHQSKASAARVVGGFDFEALD